MADQPVSTVDFKPSDVSLSSSFPPLVGTMGRVEAEMAAVLLVRACQVYGDAWQTITPSKLGMVIRGDLEARCEPLHSMNGNPFCRPDVHELVRRGFAEWVGEPGHDVRFTPLGQEVLRKVVERSTVTCRFCNRSRSRRAMERTARGDGWQATQWSTGADDGR